MPSRAGWLLVLLAGVVAALAWNAVGRRGRQRTALPSVPEATASALDPRLWPGEGATLTPPAATFREGSGVLRVMIDPGHGAPNNHGNTSSFCVEEQDAMLDVAGGLADRLEETGHVAARLARDPGRLVEYPARLEEAAAWGADAFVSLHSDVRGRIERWSPAPGRDCPFAVDAPGFAVLYSDEGDPALTARRAALARAVARRMGEAGFLPYAGAAYVGIYAADEQAPGAFVDRHAAEQRIFVLRRAAMPSILIETHNALDPREATRWTEPETLDAFAAALAAALGDVTPHREGAVPMLMPRRGGT
jgi:N-acetylmuramoyl-L-alanine amidase